MQKKVLIIVVVFSVSVGFATSLALQKLNWFEKKQVNIFEEIKQEAQEIRLSNTTDSILIHEPLRIDGEILFAGERVPLEDHDVFERLDRELQINTFWHSNTILSMKLANRYFPMIEKVLEEEGVPNDFKYLALIESGFRDVVSPAGAAGFWQFLSSTAKIYKLEIRDGIDERYNVEKSTRAACVYLKQAKEKLGNWTIAAAAYNLGIDGMVNRCKTQNTNNYYDLLLTQETSRYVLRMVAMKIVFSNPEAAGYHLTTEDLYQPYQYQTIVVDSTISNITDFAAGFGLQYRHIKLLNPWLRDNYLTNRDRKQYEIKIMQ